MNELQSASAAVDEYIAAAPEAVRPLLESIRAVIRDAAPDAVERIGYGMPGYYLNGGLVWFGVFKNHIGFYPAPHGLDAFEAELSQYVRTKGSVHFPFDRPLPLDLIARIVRFRREENLGKRRSRSKK